jgi:hypothetical protein
MFRQSHVAAGLALTALGLGCSSSALADQGGWYFGVSGALTSTSQSKGDIDDGLIAALDQGLTDQGLNLAASAADSDLDDSDQGFGVHIGYRFNRWIATEVGYLDLGRFTYTSQLDLLVDDGAGGPQQEFLVDADARIEAKGPFASVIGIFAINDRFDVHVRGGLLFADTRVRVREVLEDVPDSFTSAEAKSDSKDVFAGIGGTWNIGDSYALRVEYQKFLDVGDDETGEVYIDALNFAILFR